MNMKINIYTSICINLIVLGVFLLVLQQLDVFMQLLFSFIPIVISVIACAIINRKRSGKCRSHVLCAAICSGLNLIVLVVEFVCISTISKTYDIYEISQRYNSEYITVSQNNSPVFSIIIFTLTSFVLHYFVMKGVFTKQEATFTEGEVL